MARAVARVCDQLGRIDDVEPVVDVAHALDELRLERRGEDETANVGHRY
jgi:hypothetical protein